MSKKKAFVRYANNKAVPGSLIVRTNAPSVGTWKEIDYDLCCGGGGCDLPPIPLSTELWGNEYPDGCIPYIQFKCDNILVFEFLVDGLPVPPNKDEFLEVLQVVYSWMGLWTLSGDEITLNLEINGFLAKALCPDGELTMDFRFVGLDCP